MNLGRGLFGFWVVLTLLWVASLWDVFWAGLIEGAWAILVFPPVVVFVLGWLVLWAFRGFRQGEG